MISVGATRGVYRYDVPGELIAYRAVGKLAAKALHDPRIDKNAFHPLHWRYLRQCSAPCCWMGGFRLVRRGILFVRQERRGK